MKDTERLRELLAAATPGPWRQGDVEKWHVFGDIGNRDLMAPGLGRVVARTNEHFIEHDTDAALIAAAVNALLELLDALATAEAERLTLARGVVARCSDIELDGEDGDALLLATSIVTVADARRIVAEADAAKKEAGDG